MEKQKKIILNEHGQISYIIDYSKFIGHEENCDAIISTITEMILFSDNRRGDEWQCRWYDFLWDTSCEECRKEIKKEEFWERCNPYNKLEDRIEKEDKGRLLNFERDFLNNQLNHCKLLQ